MPRRKASADQSAEHTKASTAGKSGSTGAAQGETKRNPGGKPRKIKDAEHLARVVEEYIIYNQEANKEDIVPPTDYDFCKFSGIGNSTLDDYIREKDTYKGYSAALKKLFQYRESYFLAAGMKNPKLAGVTNFALKQRKNGQWEDKPTVQVEARELTIVHGQSISDDSFK